MRRLAVLGLVLSVTALLFGGAVQAEQATSVSYQAQGTWGVLTISGAPGQPFAAWDSSGALVASGGLPESEVSMAVSNCGPNAQGILLHVRVGETVFMATDDGGWFWD